MNYPFPAVYESDLVTLAVASTSEPPSFSASFKLPKGGPALADLVCMVWLDSGDGQSKTVATYKALREDKPGTITVDVWLTNCSDQGVCDGHVTVHDTREQPPA